MDTKVLFMAALIALLAHLAARAAARAKFKGTKAV